ncbi:60S ribosome subunit biogenesis protein NIP7 homolog isoform X2 [Panulirus ornatus]|uniref:60S ribosome subunit biogenesis protein NIP7 homolog isoform X2 n=1 Tax=Panulirus ornatus TaxID=150431 RepID=UPI003A88E336
MRPLDQKETLMVFNKLKNYIGGNIRVLLERPDGLYCFRLQRDRIYYVKESIMKFAANLPRDSNKVWLRESAEQNFMYGNHVLKSGMARISENTPKYAGLIVFSSKDIPLGFGVSAKATAECRHADPMDIVCFHQADIGEYIRNEEELV